MIALAAIGLADAGMATAERGRFALWLPVFMGAGVLLLLCPARRAAMVGRRISAAACGRIGAVLARPWPVLRATLTALAAVALGFAAGQFATIMAPPLDKLPSHAAVFTGTVRGLEAVPRGRRITLDEVRIDGADAPLNRRIRIRLKSNDAGQVTSGDRISVRALVQPASPPAYPGGWDMQRDAFFADLAGSGYALGPVTRNDRAPAGVMLWILRLREAINDRIDRCCPMRRAHWRRPCSPA